MDKKSNLNNTVKIYNNNNVSTGPVKVINPYDWKPKTPLVNPQNNNR